MQFLDTTRLLLFAGLSTETLRKLKKNIGQCKSLGKDSKRDYAKEKLRENMGQSECKERDFKEQKRNTLEARP
jgi:hypothetical protein